MPQANSLVQFVHALTTYRRKNFATITQTHVAERAKLAVHNVSAIERKRQENWRIRDVEQYAAGLGMVFEIRWKPKDTSAIASKPITEKPATNGKPVSKAKKAKPKPAVAPPETDLNETPLTQQEINDLPYGSRKVWDAGNLSIKDARKSLAYHRQQ